MKKYTSDIRNVEARPRSERLRKLGVPVSASGRNVINVSDGAAASGDDGWKELIGKDPETGFLNLLRTVARLALGSRGKSVSDIVDSEDLKAEGVELTDDALITAKAAVGSIDELLKDALAKLNDIFIHKDREDSTEFLVRFLAGLEYGLYAEGGTDGGKLHPDGLAELGRLRSNGDAEFRGSLSSKEFISGFNTGKGWALRLRKFLNAAGVEEEKAEMELDNLIVRGTMRVFEFIVSQMLGENDNRIFTGMMEVDHYDPKTGTVYLQTEDGKLYNPFRKNDIIIVQQYNGMPSEGNGYYVTKQYELLVTEVGVGNLSDKEDRLDWLRFANFTTTMEGVSPEELITKGDTFVRIDNLTDPDRKGIIQMMTVGSDTPYMDILYGAKTDPANKLKGRFGNLKGVYNPLFGWLREFGAYLINLYAVGEFRLRATGESLDTRIEMLRNQFVTNYRQWEYELTEEDNFLHNAVFSDSMEGWTVLHQPELITVNGNPMLLNRAVALTKTGIAAPEEHDGRIMLRIRGNGVRQANALIRQPGTHKRYVMDDDGVITEVEEPDTLYLSLCAQFVTSGTLEIGFEGASSAEGALHDYIESIDASNDYVTMQWSGVWDGTGDFRLSYTGDCYIRLLSMTTDPLDNYRTETQTWLNQTGRVIGLYGQRISRTEKSATDLKVEIDAANGRIDMNATSIDTLVGRADSMGVRIDALDKSLGNYVAGIEGRLDGLETSISQAQEDADAANGLLEEWSRDGVISPMEKQSVHDEMIRVEAHRSELKKAFASNPELAEDAAAKTALSLYESAYTAYHTQLEGMCRDNSVTAIPDDFATVQKTYYDKRADCIVAADNCIKAKLEGLITQAKGLAEKAAPHTYSQASDPWDEWEEPKSMHVGDIWRNTSDGHMYRYIGHDGSRNWEDLSDTAASVSYILETKDYISAVVANFDEHGNVLESSGIVTTAYGSTMYATKTDLSSVQSDLTDLSGVASGLVSKYNTLNNTVSTYTTRTATLEANLDSLSGTVSSVKTTANNAAIAAGNAKDAADSASAAASNASTAASNASTAASNASAAAAEAKKLVETAKRNILDVVCNNGEAVYDYNQTSNPWSSWAGGTEYTHFGETWYNPSDGLVRVYAGTTSSPNSNTWITLSSHNTLAWINSYADKISAVVSSFDNQGNLINTSGLLTEDNFSTLFSRHVTSTGLVKKAELGTYVEYNPSTGQITSGIKLTADKITFNGYTNINNGALKVATDGTVTIGGFTVDNGVLNWKQYGYFGTDPRSLKLGMSSSDTEGIVDIKFNMASTGRFGVKVLGAAAGGAGIFSSRYYTDGTAKFPTYNNTYAGFFDGAVMCTEGYMTISKKGNIKGGIDGAVRIDNSDTWFIFSRGICIGIKSPRTYYPDNDE